MEFSIITITYNAERHIEKTMRSVLNQAYDDYEYIIIDGASDDHTMEIVGSIKKEFDEKKVPLTVLSESDHGISDAFNKGILRASGEFIGIINSGDELNRNAFEIIDQYVEKDTDIIFGNVIWNDEKHDVTYIRKSKYKELRNLKYEMVIMHPSVFVRNNVYKELGMFDINLKYAMDQDLLTRFYRAGKQFQYIDYPIAVMSSGGISDTHVIESLRESKSVSTKNGVSRLFANILFVKKYIKNRLATIYKHMKYSK